MDTTRGKSFLCHSDDVRIRPAPIGWRSQLTSIIINAESIVVVTLVAGGNVRVSTKVGSVEVSVYGITSRRKKTTARVGWRERGDRE